MAVIAVAARHGGGGVIEGGFVFERVRGQDEGLDAGEHGGERGEVGLPFAFGGTVPGSDEAEADCRGKIRRFLRARKEGEKGCKPLPLA